MALMFLQRKTFDNNESYIYIYALQIKNKITNLNKGKHTKQSYFQNFILKYLQHLELSFIFYECICKA